MASLHEIKGRIGNINATKKITRAMYLISASKSQKAKGQLERSFPYFQQIRATMSEILSSEEDHTIPYLTPPEGAVKPEHRPNLYVVLAGDKGMAGGYNHNIVDLVERCADRERDELIVIGAVGRSRLRQLGYRFDLNLDIPVVDPDLHRARDLMELVLEEYDSGRYREVYVVYTEMITPLKQVPTSLQLLPLETERIHRDVVSSQDSPEYYPSPGEVFRGLVPHYLLGMLYSALVESFASEQHARMFAMDGATKSADETIAQLSIAYNRARQARITQELNEIIGGIPER